MTLKELLANTALKMDLLSASPSLRVRKQPQYETIFGGILSLIIMVLFSYFLYLQMDSMLNHLQITYTQGLSYDIQSSTYIREFPFAISIQDVNLRQTPRKFMVQLWQNSIVTSSSGPPTKIKTSITLSSCQISDWTSYGSNFQSQADAFGFTQMLCIPKTTNISLSGYAGSTTYEYLNLQILACDQSKDMSCDTTSNINTYVNNYVSQNDYFKVRFFVLNTILTPTNTNPITRILQKNIFVAFSKTIGTFGYINMATYQIDTDISLLPNSIVTSLTGNYIQTYSSNSVSLSGTKYVDYYIYKSTQSLSISRTMGKIDTVLSYVGGLFSLIFTAISFFLGSYSQYKYQIYVAQSMLTVDQKDLGFFTYILYSIYDWLDTFGVAPQCFTKLKEIHEVRQQACEQLDPVLILKRIKYLQDMSKVVLSEHKELCLYLSQPLTLTQARRMRNTLHHYDNLMREMSQYKKQIVIQNSLEEKTFNFTKNNKVYNQSQLQSAKNEQKQPQKELTQDQEAQILNNMLHDAQIKLEEDNSELAEKIKEKISYKTKFYINQTKKIASINDTNSNVQMELISPLDNVKKTVEILSQPNERKEQGYIKIKKAKI